MPINRDALNQLDFYPITDSTIETCWGKTPFPDRFVLIMAIKNKAPGRPYGILARDKTNGIFAIGLNGVLSMCPNNLAREFIKKAERQDLENHRVTWGGARNGAGRPKELPVSAVRRCIALTDEEFEFVKECVRLFRQKHNA